MNSAFARFTTLMMGLGFLFAWASQPVYSAGRAGNTPDSVTMFLPLVGYDNPPEPPNSPWPSDASSIDQLVPLLTWSCTDINLNDPLRYDIYFEEGDISPDVLVSEQQSVQSYQAGPLAAETTYFWQIIAFDSYGARTEGPVWRFTTGANIALPGPFNKSAPANGALDQPTTEVILNWTASATPVSRSGEASYAFCVDASNDGACWPWVGTNNAATGRVGGLSPHTVYYWQVKAMNMSGDVYADGGLSAVWSFTTAGEAVIPGEMVVIPAGNFEMGCNPQDNDGFSCFPAEQPRRTVYLDAYRIDKYEVTNRQYAECVAAGACIPTVNTYYDNPEYALYPVISIPWEQANQYCAWAGKRLPSEAEWEKAARGSSDTRVFPWGNQSPNCTLANWSTAPACVGHISAVGAFPDGASPYGVMDMAGNVWEWVNDWWQWDYYPTAPASNPTGPESGQYKVLRGGAWNEFDWTNWVEGPGYDPLSLRLTNRRYDPPDSASFYNDVFGFRCAASGE